MSENPSAKARKPRADSQRNREHLLETAKTAFTQIGADAPLEEIARRAGVGIGTLYRHFPTRDALIAAVYAREVEQLSASARRLLEERRPGEALDVWLDQLIAYMATKRVIAPVLCADPGEGSRIYASSGASIVQAMNTLTEAAIAAGDIRGDIGREDVYRLMIGISQGYERPGWEVSARRLVGVMMAGLRAG